MFFVKHINLLKFEDLIDQFNLNMNKVVEELTCSEYSTPLAPYDLAIASIFSLILISKGYKNFNG